MAICVLLPCAPAGQDRPGHTGKPRSRMRDFFLLAPNRLQVRYPPPTQGPRGEMDHQRLRAIMTGRHTSLAVTVIRGLLWPMSLAYAATMRVRRWAYRAGICRSTSASVPVICVGNLSMGGMCIEVPATQIVGKGAVDIYSAYLNNSIYSIYAQAEICWVAPISAGDGKSAARRRIGLKFECSSKQETRIARRVKKRFVICGFVTA